MIERLQRIATNLARFRRLIVAIAGLTFVLLLLSLLNVFGLNSDLLLIPSIITFSWAITLFSVSGLFVTIPEKAERGAKWKQRISSSMRRGSLWVLAFLTIALTLSLILLSYQLLRIWVIS